MADNNEKKESKTMSDENNSIGSDTPQAPVQFEINGQYVKDFSFENPNAPQAFLNASGQPDINIKVDVTARRVGDNVYESTLSIAVSAVLEKATIFVCELAYAGLFSIRNLPAQQLSPVLLIECPRLLFPFARQIIADATRNGGYPPLMLQPIDFTALYNAEASQEQGSQSQGDNESSKPNGKRKAG
jgi:preprotein translocase subunit SecB